MVTNIVLYKYSKTNEKQLAKLEGKSGELMDDYRRWLVLGTAYILELEDAPAVIANLMYYNTSTSVRQLGKALERGYEINSKGLILLK